METLLEAKEVTKIYEKSIRPSLSKVSFRVAEGEFIGIWKDNAAQCTLHD